MKRQDIPEYLQWLRDINGRNITPLSYISHKYDLQQVLLLSSLFSPDFVEYKASVFIKYQFSQDGVDDWERRLDGKMSEVQKVMNHLHISQLFVNDDPNEDINFELLKMLCDIIAACWRGALLSAYPDRNFSVEAFYDNDDFDPYTTFWEVGT